VRPLTAADWGLIILLAWIPVTTIEVGKLLRNRFFSKTVEQ
jgi:hypothetical protein